MKKSLSIILLLTIAVFSYGQKGSVSKAKNYRNKGDLISAKAEIDVAITVEKTAKKYGTWFERGEIYKAILTSTDEATRALDENALDKALEAFQKVNEMEGENSAGAILAGQSLEGIWGYYVNNGAELNGVKDYKGAYTNFSNGLKVKPTDSLTLLYSGVVAQQAEMYDKTLTHYNQLVELNYASTDVFSTIIYIERAINKNEDKALEVIQKAKEVYPLESSFRQEEIAILINLDRLEQAKDKLRSEIEKDPENPNLYLNLAIMHDNIGSANLEKGDAEGANANYEIAKENYKKAVELNPESYVGNFNLGAIYVNSAKVYYDQVRDMNLKEYDKKGPAMIEKANAILNEGLPYMKKATEIKPDDIGGLTALQQMYTQLKNYDEAEAIMNKIDELKGAGQ